MELPYENDESLMRAVADDRSESMAPLVRRYANALLTFIQGMVGHRQRSEEIFQEVFLAVWTRRNQYQYPRPFRPWLYTIAINKCREALRGRDRPAELPLLHEDALPAADDWSSPGTRLVATETAAAVRHAVSRLPEKQRLVVVLRVWNGLSYAQIGETLGTAEGTVRSNMHDALASIRRHLEPRLR